MQLLLVIAKNANLSYRYVSYISKHDITSIDIFQNHEETL